MKKQVGIWIDSSKAIFISFPDGERQILEIASEIENSVYHGDEGDHGEFMGVRTLATKGNLKNEKGIRRTSF